MNVCLTALNDSKDVEIYSQKPLHLWMVLIYYLHQIHFHGDILHPGLVLIHRRLPFHLRMVLIYCLHQIQFHGDLLAFGWY